MKIEYPKLKKIGDPKAFFKRSLISIAIVAVLGTATGYFAGHFMQQGFRDITGFNKEVSTEEMTKPIPLPTNTRASDEGSALVELMNITTNTLNAITYSKLMQEANHTSWKILSTILYPLFLTIDFAAFWLSFILGFIITGWLANKLLTLRNKALYGGVDPQLIKNMESLEAKVKELVDRANTGSI